MTKVTAQTNMTCQGEPRKKGETFDVTESVAKQLVSTKLAVISEAEEPKPPSSPRPKKKQTPTVTPPKQ